MANELIYTAACAATYFTAAIPFGYVTAKMVGGKDLREEGSGNIGATNVARVLGWKWFFPVVVLDFMKGFAPTFWLAPWVWNNWQCDYCTYGEALMPIFVGAMAIAGHTWPVYLSFRGGKAVATGAGVIFALNWPAGVIGVGVFLLVFALTRTVSLGSILSALAVGVSQFFTGGYTRFDDSIRAPVEVFLAGLAGLVIARHRENLIRLWRGEEHRFGSGNGTNGEEAQDEQG